MFETIKKLFGFKKEEKKEITVDKGSIKDAEMYYEEHQYAIKQRVNELIKLVKDRLADNGIKITDMNSNFSIKSPLQSFDYLLESIFMLEAMLIEIDINIDKIKKIVKEDYEFFIKFPIFQCDIENYRNMGAYLEARLMTEEEIMEHECLKKLNMI